MQEMNIRKILRLSENPSSLLYVPLLWYLEHNLLIKSIELSLIYKI